MGIPRAIDVSRKADIIRLKSRGGGGRDVRCETRDIPKASLSTLNLRHMNLRNKWLITIKSNNIQILYSRYWESKIYT